MVLVKFVAGLVFSILVGALIGVEREHVRATEKFRGLPIFGIRTIILFSLLGFFFSFFAVYIDAMYIVGIGALASLVITTVVYFSNVLVKRYTGSTTYIAMMIVFFLGAFVGLGGYINYLIAAIGSIVTTAFLAGRSKLRLISRKIEKSEIFGAVKFGIIALIILPLLPNRTLDPFGLFNPFQLWYVVVLVSAIYFVSYVLLKLFSEKGLILTSVLGGMLSSSMVTYQIAGWLRRNKKLISAATTGVLFAVVAGVIADLVIIAVVFNKWDLLMTILPSISAAIAFILIIVFVIHKKQKKTYRIDLNTKSPFALKSALKFGAFYFILICIEYLVGHFFGVFGIYPVTIAASLVSSTTAIISVVTLYSLGQIGLADTTRLVLSAVAVSFLSKIFWVSTAKNPELTKKIAFVVTAGTIIGFGTFLLQSLFF